MTMQNFVNQLGKELGVSRTKAKVIYRTFIATALEALAHGEDVRLEGLGRLTSRAERNRAGEKEAIIVRLEFIPFRDAREKLAELCPFREEILEALPEAGEVNQP